MVLPATYVGEHLALGYASTVHAAQGLTVDLTHSVITRGRRWGRDPVRGRNRQDEIRVE